MRAGSIAAAALAMLLIAPAARADMASHSDADDTRGRLDIASVRQGHDYGKLRYGLKTFENWADRALAHGRFMFRFNIDPDPRFERVLVVGWNEWKKTEGGNLTSALKNSKGKKIASVGRAHWSGNRLRVWIARKHLGSPTDYSVTIASRWRGRPCRDETCVDRVDDFHHHLWPLCEGRDPTIVGTTGDDTISGTEDSDVIYGWTGDDHISTGGGFDTVCGGDGNDTLVGSKRPDWLWGGVGNDTIRGRGATYRCDDTPEDPSGDCALPANELRGGPGDDRLYGGSATDFIFGGHGYDFLDGGVEDRHTGDDECRGGEVEQQC